MTCSTCRSSTCSGCCSTSGTPYYSQADTCAEDHCQRVYQQQFSFALCPQSSWNVPLCGQSSVLNVPGVVGASVGSFMWHEEYGYFEIISVDAERGQIGISNPCTTGNAAPGTQIPACTCFVVTVPPAETDADSQACVAVDFTAPVEDVPLDITVTSTEGLIAGYTIQIGTGFYFLQAVKPNNIITIINRGEGIIPGTPVIAYDANGNLNYCISVISTNPCDADPITTGAILVCNEDGVTSPLGDCGEGWVPTVVDEDCNVEFMPANDPSVCVRLTEALSIVNGDATYTLVLSDTSVFAVNDYLIIQGQSEWFKITVVTDATHVDVTATPTPTANATVAADSWVCLIGCCERLSSDIATQKIGSSTQEVVETAQLEPTEEWSSTQVNFLITNPSSRQAALMINLDVIVSNYLNTDAGDDLHTWLEAYFRQYVAFATGVIGTTVAPVPALYSTVRKILAANTTFTGLGVDEAWGDHTQHFAWVVNVPAGHEYRVSTYCNALNNDGGDPDADLFITFSSIKITALQVMAA